jgi:hypothetical protein
MVERKNYLPEFKILLMNKFVILLKLINLLSIIEDKEKNV